MFNLKKKPKDIKEVWMIQQRNGNLFLGACKADIVMLKDPSACFRFADINAAGLFIYWLVQRNEIKEGSYQVVKSIVEIKK